MIHAHQQTALHHLPQRISQLLRQTQKGLIPLRMSSRRTRLLHPRLVRIDVRFQPKHERPLHDPLPILLGTHVSHEGRPRLGNGLRFSRMGFGPEIFLSEVGKAGRDGYVVYPGEEVFVEPVVGGGFVVEEHSREGEFGGYSGPSSSTASAEIDVILIARRLLPIHMMRTPHVNPQPFELLNVPKPEMGIALIRKFDAQPRQNRFVSHLHLLLPIASTELVPVLLSKKQLLQPLPIPFQSLIFGPQTHDDRSPSRSQRPSFEEVVQSLPYRFFRDVRGGIIVPRESMDLFGSQSGVVGTRVGEASEVREVGAAPHELRAEVGVDGEAEGVFVSGVGWCGVVGGDVISVRWGLFVRKIVGFRRAFLIERTKRLCRRRIVFSSPCEILPSAIIVGSIAIAIAIATTIPSHRMSLQQFLPHVDLHFVLPEIQSVRIGRLVILTKPLANPFFHDIVSKAFQILRPHRQGDARGDHLRIDESRPELPNGTEFVSIAHPLSKGITQFLQGRFVLHFHDLASLLLLLLRQDFDIPP
mmetsp:Transcript_13404/g.25220  ORF Transcript_13404/g.25220 Transcript_13404/m.25220 type:complete len:529 (-) Transcript_13404:1095-2681(-)